MIDTFPLLKSIGDMSTPSSTTSFGGPRAPTISAMVGRRSMVEANYKCQHTIHLWMEWLKMIGEHNKS